MGEGKPSPEDIQKEIDSILENAPTVEGYNVKDLAERIGAPFNSRSWNRRLYEERFRRGRHVGLGRPKVYVLEKKE